MSTHDPPHPGELIRDIYLASYDLNARHVARNLSVSTSTFNRLLKGERVAYPLRWTCTWSGFRGGSNAETLNEQPRHERES